MVLVDTTVWSIALRRRPEVPGEAEARVAREWAELVRDGRVRIIGPIRQEILSGIRDERRFKILRDHLSAFPDVEIMPQDYVEAALFFNRCRSAGVSGAHVDMLICAVAARNTWPIFTLDDDFPRYAQWLPIQLHRP